jgi:hypothetical protein
MFIEGETQTYRIENEITPRAFAFFVQWLYAQRIGDGREFKLDGLKIGNYALSMAQLWVFGEKYLMPRLQNAAIEEMHRACVNFAVLPPNLIAYSYKNTLPKSPLRRLLILYHVMHVPNDGFREAMVTAGYNMEVILDIVAELKNTRKHSRHMSPIVPNEFLVLDGTEPAAGDEHSQGQSSSNQPKLQPI